MYWQSRAVRCVTAMRLNFYFKQNQKQKSSQPTSDLSDLVRPFKNCPCDRNLATEINGVARSLQQLCKGLQALGHKILLIRPEQKQHDGPVSAL